ncbi:MAG: hypothetical protein KGJ23_06750 [Euryarchaeota archaeon]|nr:hypothetical protein [Euryarchaeota archaeon]MDE1836298.1 hypothetical protein [Euryarchaeota archaeon]MDE1879096.1 hypothetical protein [Euryarchaeota archaeon]MDE2044306.1 hypothetical protein [Thermoplasmata archaeon]
MAAVVGAISLEELRRAYKECAAKSGGHCTDHAHAEALLAGLEKEVRRLAAQMDRTGTVYHVPATPPKRGK